MEDGEERLVQMVRTEGLVHTVVVIRTWIAVSPEQMLRQPPHDEEVGWTTSTDDAW